MELLQSQAPVDRELSGSSASARHGTFDIGHQTSDMGHGTQKFGNIEEKLNILKKFQFCLSSIFQNSHVPCLMSNVQCQKSHVQLKLKILTIPSLLELDSEAAPSCSLQKTDFFHQDASKHKALSKNVGNELLGTELLNQLPTKTFFLQYLIYSITLSISNSLRILLMQKIC